MKNLIFGLVLCLSMAVVVQAGVPITVPNFSFEEPCTVKHENWELVPNWNSDTVAVDSGVEKDGICVTDGDWNGFLMQTDPCVWNLTNHTIAAGETFTLSVDTTTGKTGGVQFHMVLYYDVAGVRTIGKATTVTALKNTIRTFTLVFNVDADMPAAVGSKLGIQLDNVGSSSPNSWMAMDNVRLEKAYVSNFSPADEETLVAVDKNLEWDLDSSVTNCDVYFGDDPNFINNPKVVDGETQGKVEIYNPPDDLANVTTYYWRVDARVDTTVYEGDVLEFTTRSLEPVVTSDPCGVTVEAGGTAVFEVKAEFADSYLWKKSDGSDAGSTDPTLTITNVQKADEDFFYCVVSNTASPIDVESARAGLWTKRLVARWEFEGDLTDAEVDGWNGAYTDPNTENPQPTAVFDPDGIDGQALSLDADVLHVRITGSEDYFTFYPQGYTVNTWIKSEQTTWGTMVSKHKRNEWPDWRGIVLNFDNSGSDAQNYLGQVRTASGDTDVADGQWHMVTGTYDADTGVVAVYVDGLLDGEGGAPSTAIAPTEDKLLIFGAELDDGSTAYDGLLDKVSIYNYPLSDVGVAVLYTDVMGGELCVGGNPEYDLNDDCQVDLEDFALLATGWMECNLVPTCMP